jgi:hypothetical protein
LLADNSFYLPVNGPRNQLTVGVGCLAALEFGKIGAIGSFPWNSAILASTRTVKSASFPLLPGANP